MSHKPDQEARDAIANALDDTLVVEAAAGTGKTTELVKRIVRILAQGKTKVQNIVAVTFTEKAAGELKLRLREALDIARQQAGSPDTLNAALAGLEEAHVSTIHGFCAELLRERPVEARVDPLFTVLTEPQAERLFDEAFGGWLQVQLQDPPEGIRRALRRSVWQGYGTAPREETPIDRLRRAAWDLAEWRDFTGAWTRRPFDRVAAIDRLVEQLNAFAALSDKPSYAKDTLFLDTAAARHLSAEIGLQQEAFRLKAEAPGSSEGKISRARAPSQSGGFRLQAEETTDYDGWEARLVDLSRDRNFCKARHGRGPGYKPGVTRARVIEALDALRVSLDQLRLDADADLAAALQRELWGAIDRYEQLKARAGALDFLDLLLKARDLVKGNAGVRRGFQQRFTHIFVDEFQDTDPLQAEILLLLAAEDPAATDWRTVTPVPGRLFIVGDPKQSIYRFRRADVGIYRDVCARLAACGAQPLQLTTSFRSVPEIQSFVNAAFAPVMTGDAATLQADYVPLSPHRSGVKGRPAVIALPVPEPYGWRNLSAMAIEKSLPDAVGAFVEWVVNESGWNVRSRDICILFRRFVSFGVDVTEPYARALEARGVRHVLVGGKSFHDREEVETIRAALAAIEWPDDELSVFATLRGALFAIGDEELLEWKQRFGAFHPFRIPMELRSGPAGLPIGEAQPIDQPGSAHSASQAPDSAPRIRDAASPVQDSASRIPDAASRGADAASRIPRSDVNHLRPIVEALQLLQRLHRRRNYIPVAETLQQLLDATRAHVGLVLRTAGEQALANVLHVAELARQYEVGGGLSFRGFVDELRLAAETAQAAEAPILEEGSDGVRMMTVHKAKGLEFPVVILADLTCKLTRAEAGRWVDPETNVCGLKLGGWAPIDLLLHDAEEAARDKAEAERLAYVAATRARDLLVVPAIGDGPYEGGWLDPLMPAIYPPEPQRRSPSRAPGTPDFRSKDTVLKRPEGDPASSRTVAPGTFVFDAMKNLEPPVLDPRSSVLGKYHVTWWDPHALHLGAVSSFGLRRDDLIVKDGDMFAVEERLADYERWRDERAQVIAQGSRETLRVKTATQWAAEAAQLGFDAALLGSEPVEIVELPGAENRPRGPRFGTLVHAVLATVPLDASDDVIERTAATEARIINATADEIAAASHIVRSVLRHEIIARARQSSMLKRETPVAWVHRDGTLIEGVLDLAFDEGDRTVVVDFKTDHELAAGETRYRAQLQQYVGAVSRATGRPASAVLFRV
jgi:ATP-dependent helicase/nuclease subunit A